MYFDHLFFKSINNLAGRWLLLDSLAIFCAEYLIFGLILFLLYLWVFKKIKFKQISLTFVSLAIVLLINRLISLFRFRVRPFITYPEIYQLIEHSSDKSFPSDHTTVAFALGMSLWFFKREWGKGSLIMAFLIGLGRIFCGLHYPLDVVTGAVLGIGVAVVTQGVIARSERKAKGK